MRIEITLAEGRRLHAMAKTINARFDAIKLAKRKFASSAADLVSEAVLIGQDLIKARSLVPHGLWVEWMRVHCPLISIRYAYKYMLLAKNVSRVTRITEMESIRAALALCVDQDGTAPAKQKHPYEIALYKSGAFIGVFERYPLERWPEEGREKLRNDLLPIVSKLWPDRFQ